MFEKNQLGLGNVFFNSLRFTWMMSLLADAAVLLRARALLGRPHLRPLLAGLMPVQLPLELEIINAKPESANNPMKSTFHTLCLAGNACFFESCVVVILLHRW